MRTPWASEKLGRRNIGLEYILPALIAGFVTAVGLYLNRRWQVRQEVRADSLKLYRVLKTFGFIHLKGLTELSQTFDFESEEGLKRLRAALLEVGRAIFDVDLSASPRVLRALVRFLQETEDFNARLEKLAAAHQKVTAQEFDAMKAPMRRAYLKLFLAMRADVGRSSLFLKRKDLEYLLLVQLNQRNVAELGKIQSEEEEQR